MAIAVNYAAILQVFRGERGEALTLAEEAADLCRAHDFP